MSKKAEMEAKEIFSHPENPLNPETLIQRTRDLQTGFEEQIKSASGGMLDLGTKKIMFFLSLPKRRNPTFAICRRFN